MSNNISIAAEVNNIRYGPIVENKGTVLFDYKGQTISIPEPKNTCLVGFENAGLYIARKYGFLLDCVKEII